MSSLFHLLYEFNYNKIKTKICDFGLARIVDEISVAHSSSTKNAKFASIPSHSAAAAAAKKAAGRSCSISEQALTRDDNDGNHMPSMPSVSS